MLLADRVAIITGGAKGMGRGMALRFAEEGCSVAIVDIAVAEAIIPLRKYLRGEGRGLLSRAT